VFVSGQSCTEYKVQQVTLPAVLESVDIWCWQIESYRHESQVNGV